MRGTWRGGAAPILVIAFVMALPIINASGALGPLNDLLALGQAGGQTPDQAPIQQPAEPPQDATPRAVCGPGSKPEPGIQGRVPAGSATSGPALQRRPRRPPGHVRRLQGLAVRRHARAASARSTTPRCCYPLNALKLDGTSQGVAVLDMSDPAHPMQTATLTELPMLSPHESLEPQRQARAARGGARQPVDQRGARLDLRRPRGLPAPGAAVDAAGRPARPRERLLARRQDVLGDRHRAAVDHRGRRDGSEGSRTRSGRATSPRTACR